MEKATQKILKAVVARVFVEPATRSHTTAMTKKDARSMFERASFLFATEIRGELANRSQSKDKRFGFSLALSCFL